MNEGIIVKILANNFWVKNAQGIFICSSRGNLKKEGLFVGDKVVISCQEEQNIIEKLCKRKNLLVRPPIANLDYLTIVVSPKPKPDFFVVDKLLLFAKCYNITPIIVVNKFDLKLNDCFDYVQKCYSKFVKTVCVSAVSGYNMNVLADLLKGKTTAFAGQSAVGKSSLIAWFMPNVSVEIGEFSKKIERGRNTTRHTELFEFEKNSFIADTPGFSFLDESLLPIKHNELAFFYDDFLSLKDKCQYSSCEHFGEGVNVCGVKRAVKNGTLDTGRFERYCQIKENLQRRWKDEHR